MNLIQFKAAQAKQLLQNNIWLEGGESRSERAEFLQSLTFAQKQAILTVIMPDGSKAWGMDGSHWNLPPVDIQRMVTQFGMSFAIFKGCDGSLNTKYFPEHVAQAEAAGIPWGMYVWLYRGVNVPIEAQATAWANRANQYKPPMGVFVDAEWTKYGGVWSNPTTTDLQQAEASFNAKYSDPAGRYTAPGYANQYLKGFDFSKGRNWIAEWGVSKPTLWAYPYEIHQFTDNLDGATLDPNGNKSLDGNYFNGTKEQLKAKYGGGSTPPDGGDMQYVIGTVNATAGLNVRGGPGTSYPILGALPYKTPVEGWLDAGFIKINYQGKDGYLMAQFVTYTVAEPPEPPKPPAGDIDIDMTLKSDGSIQGTWKDV